ncbi:aldehyde dehydrogenase [Ramlibacter sp. GTP1]|uniref:Aldehyde dehydrogenase n=2 Tax=Ramlibacter albus TaxID=2079448 RepID=A0A923MC01_9BURK|nr:aldehyde dehydrogenase [Ramlibacter albus]
MGEVMSIDRRAFVAALVAQCPDALVVTGLGSPSYDAFAAGDRPGNFYLWGAMGGAAAVALGLALAKPSRPVIAITGDGEQLMGLGALATAAVQRPDNLTVVVLDNGHFGETGMQRSHSSLGLNLVAVAKGCGIEDAVVVREMDGVQAIARRVNAKAGLALAQVIVAADELPRALPPRDGVYLKNRVREHLGLAPL